MPEAVIEKIQPCLLDRLTDESPEAQKESRSERIVSMRRYRDGVLRDLAWLLNAKAHTAAEDLNEFPEASSSVLNFGTRDLCGLISTNVDLEDIEHDIADAVRRFEPRINPRTIEVKATPGSKRDSMGLSIEIRGELWAYPLPEELYLRTEVDLDTGEYTI